MKLSDVEAVVQAIVSATQPEKTWPPGLRFLTRWASDQARSRRSQQQQEQHQEQELLSRVTAGVLAALERAAADGADGGATEPGALAMLGPSITFLAAALPAATGPAAAAGELQQQAVAAACAALTALTPALLLEHTQLQLVLSSCAQLLAACLAAPHLLMWLLSCLLAALHSALPASLTQQQQRLQQQTNSTAAAAAGADMQAWPSSQAQALAVAQLLEPLAGLSSLGQHLGRILCTAAAQRSRQPSKPAGSGAAGRAPPAKPWAVAAAAAAARQAPAVATPSCAAAGVQQLQQQPQQQAMQGLCQVVGLLQLAVEQGDQLLAALAGATAAGVLSGCLSVTLSGPAQQSQQQQPQQRQQQHNRHHHRRGRNQQQGAAAAGGSGGSSELELQPLWQQELEQQVLLLLQALQRACGKRQAASPQAVCALSEQLLGQAYSRTMVAHGSTLQLLLHSAWHAAWPGQQQQQQQGLYSLAGLLCSLSYLLQQSCSIAGVLYHAGCRADASAANSWLSRQQQLQAPHEVGAAVRWLAAAAAQLQPPALLLALLQAMRAAAAALAGSYSCFLQGTAGGVVQAVDSSALRQQLDRAFALHVVVLAAISDQLQRQQQQQKHAVEAAQPADSSSSKRLPNDRDVDAAATQDQPAAAAVAAAAAAMHSEWHQLQAAVVSQGLAGLSELQFCRVQLPAYVELLTQLVAALAGNAAAADAFVAALPCYDALLHPAAAAAAAAASEGLGQQQRSSTNSIGSPDRPRKWLADAVTVARLSFLLPLIPVACRASSAPQQSAAAVLPLLLLLLPHPMDQVAQAAHAAFVSLFSGAAAAAASAADDTQDPAAAAAACRPAQQQQDLLVQAVPFYLQRSLVALPAGGSCQGFAAGFHCLLTELPVAHPVMLLAVERVASKVLQLVAEQQQQPLPHEPLPAAAAADAGSSQPGQAAADKLFELLQMALQLADYQLLPTVLQQVAGCVLAAPAASLQNAWLSRLHGACLATEDQTRKTALLVWLDGLSRQLTQQQQQQQQQLWQPAAQQVAGATVGVADDHGGEC